MTRRLPRRHALRSTPASHPPDSEHASRQAEIRNKARDLFIRWGYRKTTIEDIGKACGLGKAALYYYFPGKEAILADVIRTEGEKVLAQIRLAVAATDDPRAQLVAMVRTSFGAVSSLIGELTGHGTAAELREWLPLAARRHQRFLDESVEILQGILDAGWRKGVFKRIQSPSVPLVIIAGLRGIHYHILEVEDPPPVQDAVDALLELFLQGICR